MLLPSCEVKLIFTFKELDLLKYITDETFFGIGMPVSFDYWFALNAILKLK